MYHEHHIHTEVVAIGFPTSTDDRRRLKTAIGPHREVLDLRDAPAWAQVVLIEQVSPQAIQKLGAEFHRARIYVLEWLGEKRNPDLCRCLSAGAAAHLVLRNLDDLAAAITVALGSLKVAA